MSEVVELKPWLTVDFPFLVAIRHVNGPWVRLFLKPSGFEIDLEALGLEVELHANGIEFLTRPKGAS